MARSSLVMQMYGMPSDCYFQVTLGRTLREPLSLIGSLNLMGFWKPCESIWPNWSAALSKPRPIDGMQRQSRWLTRLLQMPTLLQNSPCSLVYLESLCYEVRSQESAKEQREEGPVGPKIDFRQDYDQKVPQHLKISTERLLILRSYQVVNILVLQCDKRNLPWWFITTPTLVSNGLVLVISPVINLQPFKKAIRSDLDSTVSLTGCGLLLYRIPLPI